MPTWSTQTTSPRSPLQPISIARKRFHEDELRLRVPRGTITNHLVFKCGGGGTSLLVYGRPSGNKADHIVTTEGIGRSARITGPDGITIAPFQPA